MSMSSQGCKGRHRMKEHKFTGTAAAGKSGWLPSLIICRVQDVFTTQSQCGLLDPGQKCTGRGLSVRTALFAPVPNTRPRFTRRNAVGQTWKQRTFTDRPDSR
jgi:hypothetical protein